MTRTKRTWWFRDEAHRRHFLDLSGAVLPHVQGWQARLVVRVCLHLTGARRRRPAAWSSPYAKTVGVFGR